MITDLLSMNISTHRVTHRWNPPGRAALTLAMAAGFFAAGLAALGETLSDTVLQQITSRHAEIDIVVIAACGERAGEVVETLRDFPELIDPRTGDGQEVGRFGNRGTQVFAPPKGWEDALLVVE